MTHLRIENFRHGAWQVRIEGDMEISAEKVATQLADYALQYPARAFLDGTLVAEVPPQMKRRDSPGTR